MEKGSIEHQKSLLEKIPAVIVEDEDLSRNQRYHFTQAAYTVGERERHYVIRARPETKKEILDLREGMPDGVSLVFGFGQGWFEMGPERLTVYGRQLPRNGFWDEFIVRKLLEPYATERGLAFGFDWDK